MKKIIALILIIILTLTGCDIASQPSDEGDAGQYTNEESTYFSTDTDNNTSEETEHEDTESEESQSESTESEGSQPEGSHPEGSQPEGGQPEGGQPEGGQPEGGQPEGGQPEGGQPEGGQPEGGQPEGDNETLYVNYIDVGQGDSILIKVGDCDILIDAGTANYGSTVSNYLKAQEVDDIELMINTHPDADHCGGLTKVLNDFLVEEVWISKDTSKKTAAYKNFIAAISTEGLSAKQPNAGTVFTYEYLTLTVIYSQKGSDSNNSSIIVMLEYGSFKFLFTGDAGQEVESKLVNSGADISCDVLKVGHHGSKYSSTSAFLNATGADYGVICVGAGNSYGHPTNEALNRLYNAGISVYRTDTNGDVVFSTNGTTLTLPNVTSGRS